MRRINLFTLILLLLLTGNIAFAENFQITAISANKPEKAFGLVFNDSGTTLINETSITAVPEIKDLYLISFNSDKVKSSDFISAILIDSESNQSYASVSLASSAASRDLSKLPACSPNPKSTLLPEESELLNQLIDVRLRIKEHNINMLLKELDAGTISDLNYLEEKLGIKSSAPFSANMPAEELNMRLFKILSALK